jgi:eukaryotic-like serine/threonine-protein kinase
LVYVPGAAAGAVPRRLLAVDFEGNAEPLIDDQRDYWRPRISPDGARIAVEVQQPDQSTQIWIVDLTSRTSTPLSADPDNGYAAWTADGGSVVYMRRAGELTIQTADGGRAAESLLEGGGTNRVMDVSRDGYVAFAAEVPREDIRMLHLESGEVSDFLATPAREHMARFSPGGRWLAYSSNESGGDEVYVRPFPRTEGVGRLVSIGGGTGPVWAPDGSTLYYRGASEIMAVPTTLSPGFSAGRPRPLFRHVGIFRMSGTATAYDIHPDGNRFIMVSEPDDQGTSQSPQQINIVLNWFEELKRLTAASR